MIEDDTERGKPFEAVQIVDPIDMVNTMRAATSPESIVMCDAEDMLGVQIADHVNERTDEQRRTRARG